MPFTVNGHTYQRPYWLADGIYPKYSVFVKTIPSTANAKEAHFAKAQESRRKDVERLFGMLQARWHILTSPCRLWSKDAMKDVVLTCCILHNIILESEMHNDVLNGTIPPEWACDSTPPVVSGGTLEHTARLVTSFENLVDASVHRQLQIDLVEHLWNIRLHNSV
jgi:hypothetical protein